MPHLWDLETHWFNKNQNEYIHSTFPYKSWNDFLDCKPYKLWKPYILSSWSWKQRSLTEPRDKGVVPSHKIILHPQIPYGTDSLAPKEEPIEMLQIVFLSPERFTGVHRAEIVVTREDEDSVKDWLQRHMPTFWKLE